MLYFPQGTSALPLTLLAAAYCYYWWTWNVKSLITERGRHIFKSSPGLLLCVQCKIDLFDL